MNRSGTEQKKPVNALLKALTGFSIADRRDK
ncbi:MAG: hypothetical protein ACI9JO_001453 [Psychrobacter okhotskensis]|jgi:hypothetical protein